MCVFDIFGKASLCLFQTICFWISRPNSSMRRDERGIFSKAPDWKPLFLLKIKIKQESGYPNKEYAILKHINQNIMAYPRSKSMCIDQWLGKYYFILGGVGNIDIDMSEV